MLYIISAITYFSAIPREHWSCCMLGILAGSKGFHCRSVFYVDLVMSADDEGGDERHDRDVLAVQTRNYNRPQTARHPGMHGLSRRRHAGHWGYDIMRSLGRRDCFVVDSGRRSATGSDVRNDEYDDNDFHRCCYAASEERRQLKRAEQYRIRHRDPLTE